MLVTWRSLNGLRNCTVQYKKQVERKRRCLAAEEARAATSRAFRPYQHTLKIVWSFKFLEIVLLAADDYCMVVIQYLTKAWAVWQRMSRILSWEGARPQVSGFFLKSFV